MLLKGRSYTNKEFNNLTAELEGDATKRNEIL